ncbi:MAG: undecaprenyl-phosphate glucose phosphotransferase [Chloroflexi bacterium]|nr:undecaprenyl-phosphate glucose phosphotransferase [Chloroflexota bacterium]
MITWARRNWGGLVSTFSLLADVVAVGLALIAAYYLRYRFGWFEGAPPNRFLFLAPVTVVFAIATVMGGLSLGMYSRFRTAGPVDRVARSAGMVTLGSLLAVAVTFFIFTDRLEPVRNVMPIAWLLGIVFVAMGRSVLAMCLRLLAQRGIGVQRVLVIGAGAEGREVGGRLLRDPSRRYELVGFLDDFESQVSIGDLELPVLGTSAALSDLIAEHEIDKVVVAIPSLSHDDLLGILAKVEASYADVWLLPDLFQLMVSPVVEGGVGGLPLIAVNEVRLRGLSRFAKRSLDLVVAAIVLVLTSAPLLLIALIIKLDSKGPAFYVQTRVGRDGRPFPIVKFRTMISGADEYGQTWTVANDPRRTRVGRLLRRYWIDELPQLLNVIRGDMSLVGPRPEQPDYVTRFRGEFSRYMVRHRERAGVTGWAQVNGMRGDSSIAERTRYDLYYVENWSLLFDLRILLRTLLIVMRGDAS